jgi:hypothetical protein
MRHNNSQNPVYHYHDNLSTALGVDDIRMDLTQFDDAAGSGRSVPVTPISQNPPTISITEPSPPPEEGSDAMILHDGQSQGRASPAVSQQEEQEITAMSSQGYLLCILLYRMSSFLTILI